MGGRKRGDSGFRNSFRLICPTKPRLDAVVDEYDGVEKTHSPKLRERSNKESTTSSILPSSIMSGSRNKRKRQIPQDARAQSLASPTERIDGTAQDMEVGASDEDKDLPPHKISGRTGRRRFPPVKVRDDYNAVNIVVVPRKLRTACRKRRRESAPPLVQDATRQQPLPATVPPSSPPIPTPSTSALKAVRRTNPNGTKFRPSKLIKVSSASTISQQEVEVAEALFDLARMLPGSASSFECKFEVKPKLVGNADSTYSVGALQSLPPALVSSPASTPTPAQACTPTSPLPSPPFSSPAVLPAAISVSMDLPISMALVVPTAAEAPKRKRPRVRAKIDEVTLTQYKPKNASAGNSRGSVLEPKVDVDHLVHFGGVDKAQVKAEVDITGSNGSTFQGSGSLHSPVAVTSSFSLLSANCMPAAGNNFIALSHEKSFTTDLSGMNHLDKVLTYLSTMDTKSVLDNTTTSGSRPIQQEVADGYQLLDACSLATKCQRAKSSSNAPVSDTHQQSKCDIDLMEQASDDASTKADLLDKESVNDDRGNLKKKKGNDNITKEGKEFVSDMEGKVGLDHTRHEVKDIQLGNLKAMEREKEKMEDLKLSSQQSGKDVKSHLALHQKSDRSVSSFPLSGPSATSSATSSISQSQPMSMGMAGWPRNLPHIVYHSPAAAAAAAAAVAAAWPGLPSIGSASVDAALQVG